MYKLDRYLGRSPKKLSRALETLAPIRPLSVKIKLTWQCNLACIMCSEWRIQGKKPPRPQFFKNFQDLKPVLDDLIALKTKKVHFSGGEPLLFPDLVQAIDYLTQANLHVSLVSNGTLWSKRRAQALIDAGLSHITFSIDSPNAQTFATIRGKEAWGLLIQGIQNTRRVIDSQNRPIKLKANTVLTQKNYREMLEYPALANQLGIDRLRFLPVDDLHIVNQSQLRLTTENIVDWNQNIAPQILKSAQIGGLIETPADLFPFGRTAEDLKHSANGHYARGFYQENHCFAPWLHSLISADGRVIGCCMLKGEKIHIDHLGPQNSFQDIWLGPAYQDFRKKMRQDKYPICAHCDDFTSENHYLNNLLATAVKPQDV